MITDGALSSRRAYAARWMVRLRFLLKKVVVSYQTGRAALCCLSTRLCCCYRRWPCATFSAVNMSGRQQPSNRCISCD